MGTVCAGAAAGGVEAAGVALVVTGAAAVADGATIGVMVTPVTFPVMAAFLVFPIVPRASRVAFAFAVAAARASADKGVRAFFGAMSSAARTVVLLANWMPSASRSFSTVGPSCAMSFASASFASAHPVFAVATALTAVSRVWTNASACADVSV